MIEPRVELQLHEHETAWQRQELGAFVRSCIDQVERAAGRSCAWRVTIVPHEACYRCNVTAQTTEFVVAAGGNGVEAAVAGREAFCKIETVLRNLRARTC
jgi:hypothetical protein